MQFPNLGFNLCVVECDLALALSGAYSGSLAADRVSWQVLRKGSLVLQSAEPAQSVYVSVRVFK